MRQYGFNMQWMFSSSRAEKPEEPNYKELDFIAKHGFNYIRLPLDYRFWTTDFNYYSLNEKVLEMVDKYVKACNERELHACVNLHRAPGYCVNHNLDEKHNLWRDKEAQDAFVFNWESLAKRYKGISNDKLSFDLLNEPGDRRGCFTRDAHEMVMRRTINAIRAIDPTRDIVLNGVDSGNAALPELADTGTIHSGRGYAPWTISHYAAEFLPFEHDWEEPVHPMLLDGVLFDRQGLIDDYKPWRDVEASGVRVYMNEIGSYNKTPTDVANAWLTDLLSVYGEFKWGYALWNFKGAYGVCEHGKPGAKYEDIEGFKIDRVLFELLKEHRHFGFW